MKACDDLLHSVYSLVADHRVCDAIDQLFDHINGLCWDEDFKSCDEILASADLGLIGLDVAIAILSITYTVRHLLSNRVGFIDRMRQRHKGDKRVEKMIASLMW
jgi:hypothetical protein